MIFKNLLRRKGRTILTVLSISIGVAAIIGLGALADGLKTGYNSMLTGSKADLVLSQQDTFDITYNAVKEEYGKELLAMPEVSAISGMLQGIVPVEESPYFFVFGYPEDSFILKRFKLVTGYGINAKETRFMHGKPIMLGSAAAETLKKKTGDTLRLSTGSAFRIVGIYQTGNAFEDSGAVIRLEDAQEVLGRPRQVSLFYIQLKDPNYKARLENRVERRWKDLSLSSASDLADKQMMSDMLQGYVWVIAGLAIIIGGVSMMNAQMMSVYERTREIGVLRAVGWSGRRVLSMILNESLLVCLVGGVVGTLFGVLVVAAFSGSSALGFLGASSININLGLIAQAFSTVIVLGLVGGLYPAWMAARLQPIEALRYEGGTLGAKVRRFPIGGMAVQSLWQRPTRTLLTVLAIGITVGAIMALEAVIRSFAAEFGGLMGAEAEIMIRQADVSDSSLSAIDERIGDKIAALPEVQAVSGVIFTAIALPDTGGFLVLQGYAPGEFALHRFKIVKGAPLTSNHQIIIGKSIASAMKKDVGDTIDLSKTRFKIVGIYETGIGWEEGGAVMTLRDGQKFVGRPRKVTMYMVKMREPAQAQALVNKINTQYPEAFAALSSEFVDQMPDMQSSYAMVNAISFMAILVGGLGVMNTMLMAVLERTREIGVLRAMGWRRRMVLGMILRESLLLALCGAASGVIIAFFFTWLMEVSLTSAMGGWVTPQWDWDIFARAVLVSVFLGLLGGLYPAYRGTRLQPVEALRYE